MSRRVVITGMAGITPLGCELPDIWGRLRAGISGVGPISLFDASRFPVRIAAEVRGWDMTDVGEDPRDWQRQARQTQFAVAAGVKAASQAGWQDFRADRTRLGVYLGCGEIFPDFRQFCDLAAEADHDGAWDLGCFWEGARHVYGVQDDLILDPGTAAALLAGRLDAQGPNANFTSACVSSSKAVGEAADAIRHDEADVMLAGGAHSMIHPFGLTGFHRLSTLSCRNDDPAGAARPFDRDRDGFVVGEGGAVLILEELMHARRRGAVILGELSGWGITHDAYRITDLDPEGRSAARSMLLALRNARLNPEDIDYINAHGSGTVINDKAETLAIKRALGNWAYHVPISSTKAMTGHLTTACGAIEALICLSVLRDQVAPPTINHQTPDPECDLDYVPNVAREILCKHVMSTNFGFGGQNVALIFSRWDG